MDVAAGWLGVVTERLGPGELAELRRLDPESPSAPAFWRLVARVPEGDAHASGRVSQESKFAVVLKTFAQLRDAHRAGRPLGVALAESGLDERRLIQLLRARRAALAHAIRTVCHFLASKGAVVDAMDFARLVLSDGARVEWEEGVRRSVARDFFREAGRPSRPAQGDDR